MRRHPALERSQGDRLLILSAALLSLIGLVALRSAAATVDATLVFKQGVWMSLGICASVLVSRVPYTRWIDVGVFLSPVVLLMLLGVFWVGTMKLGATRWLTMFGMSVQPSELAKLVTACWLARQLGNHPYPVPLRRLVLSAITIGIPAALIFFQPDLGSSSILGAIWLGAAWSAGMSRKTLLGLGVAGIALLPGAWWVLKDYQRLRLAAFLNPHADPLGAGYTIIQSKIAIGSGGVLGRGWLAGTQSQLNFLPERHTDFLYSVIGEEWGFIGSVLVVLLFGLLLWRALTIAQRNTDPQGRVLAVALASWIAYQAWVNMGMVMGLLPVVGVPLPFVSYGGSAMVTLWIAIGLLQSLKRHGTRF